MFWGGIAAGLAQAINYLSDREMVNLSAALASLVAWAEDSFTPGIGIFSKTFPARVNPFLAGIMAGAAMVGLMESWRRLLVNCRFRVLASSLAGGVLFGFGASLAGGDFFYHAVGGMALMQVSSLFVVALSIPFVFLSLEIMSVLNTSPMFLPDQQRSEAGFGKSSLYREGGLSGKNSDLGHSHYIYSLLAGLASALLLVSAIFQQEGARFANLFSGLFLGAVIAKTGFGIEWGLLVPDTVRIRPRYMDQLGIPRDSAELLRSAAPLRAWLAAVCIAGVAGLGYWLAKGAPYEGPSGLSATGLNIGHVAGAPLLAAGSMLMMGCDFRTYARAGLGYGTAVFALLGIILGNIPFVFWQDDISAWLQANIISSESWLPRLLPQSPVFQGGAWALFLAFLVLIIVYTTVRNTKIKLDSS